MCVCINLNQYMYLYLYVYIAFVLIHRLDFVTMRVNKGKKGVQLGAKKKKSNREQKADAETHVKLNSDGI